MWAYHERGEDDCNHNFGCWRENDATGAQIQIHKGKNREGQGFVREQMTLLIVSDSRREFCRMPPKPGKKTLPDREIGEGSSQQAREVGGDGAGESTGSEEEEEVDPLEIERRGRKKGEDREARRRMDQRERRLNEREEALRKKQRDHDERIRRSTSRRVRRERSGGAGRELGGRSTSRARRSPGRGGRSRSPARRGRAGSEGRRRTRSRTPLRRRSGQGVRQGGGREQEARQEGDHTAGA